MQMKNAWWKFYGGHTGFALVALALALLVPPEWTSACDKKEQPPTMDDIRIARTKDGDVTINVYGPTTYIGWTFSPLGSPEEAKKGGRTHLFVVEWIARDGKHQVQHLIGNARSVKLQNVICQIKRREMKSFERHRGRTYSLLCGPDAVPGEKLFVKGAFTWNSADGAEHFFHEDGTGRVWKTVPPPEKKEKEKK